MRFLGEYDKVLLGHDDRARNIPPEVPWQTLYAAGRSVGGVLVDGMLAATWWLERDGSRSATLAIRPAGRLPRPARDEVEGEAWRLVSFLAADAERRDVRIEPPVD